MRLSIDKTREVIVAGTSTCVELLRFFQSKGSWVNLPPEVARIRQRLRIEDYVQLYDEPRKIGTCFLLAFMDAQDLKTWGEEVEAMTPEDQQEQLEEFSTGIQELGVTLEKVLDIAPTEQARLEANNAFEALTDDEKKSVTRLQRIKGAVVEYLACQLGLPWCCVFVAAEMKRAQDFS